jgi:hypothetical protein
VYMWLNRATLDIIGLAGNLLSLLTAPLAHSESHIGFNYSFDSLRSSTEEKTSNDTYRAIRSVLSRVGLPDPLFALQLFFPMFRLIVSISLYQRGGETNRITHFSTANSSLSSSWSRFQRNSAHWITTYPGQEGCCAR